MQTINKEDIKCQIEEKIIKLNDDILKLIDLTKPISPDCAIGRISRMDAINNKSINEAALRQRKTQLKALEFALNHVDDTDFGNCVNCCREIPLGRIILMPESKKCVACASR
ncbi:conjugal transfer protein TraR [Ancylomarina euxinus]|uniref:Conjugal transfer protein TraR n=1 Tax=Ancylomarina euxinus TaxID=2283627 RepID=A0A425XXH7_9BACT|nr:conjugal transfer protein TraR [Ancylomarina euxinus]MCZ4696067.1 TraR/DksA family transcriptional regulator [Ancylomarina euxinus]MUP16476.1 conjugal transfer protein TraR [Ancylomarina euxinus]RRG19368.1 conjugal transfer protein TraR [Ancylomarina euxinus]